MKFFVFLSYQRVEAPDIFLFDVLWQTRRKFILNWTMNTPSSVCPRLNENLYLTNLSQT